MPTANIFNLTPSTIDQTPEMVLNGAVAERAADGDEFGTALDVAMWTQYLNNCLYPESGNKLNYDDNNPGGASDGQSLREGNLAVSDYDFYVKFDPTNAGNAAYVGGCGIWMVVPPKDTNNLIQVRYRAKSAAGSQLLSALSILNGVVNVRYNVNQGTRDPIWLRIYRDATGATPNNISYYWAVADPVPTPANWMLIGTWQERAVGFFDENSSLSAGTIGDKSASASDYQQSAEYFRQWTGTIASQRFWKGSSEIYIIDNALVEWTFDAGAGKVWDLTGAAATVSAPGGSSWDFRAGGSNDGLDASVVFDAYAPIATISTRAAAGNYWGFRYLHVRAQVTNPSGADKPDITDFTFNGTAVLPTTRSQRAHNRMRRIKYGKVQRR